MFILPYKMASASAKALAGELGITRIRTEASRFKGNEGKTVINWGNSEVSDEVAKCNIINKPECVAIASNKLKFFQKMEVHNDSLYELDDWSGEGFIRVPKHTTSQNTANIWLRSGCMVVERHKLTGNSGEGIVLAESGEVGAAPLYVQYIPKKQEYRVHVAGGKVVDLQRKARRRDVEDEHINWRIRNHDNGFIFQRNDLVVPHQVREQALNACVACGLDFGAVDIIFNERSSKAYVLEINTAPGLTGQTLEGYVERFRNWGGEAEPEAPKRPRVAVDLGAVAPIPTPVAAPI